jgi:hypothetical protein
MRNGLGEICAKGFLVRLRSLELPTRVGGWDDLTMCGMHTLESISYQQRVSSMNSGVLVVLVVQKKKEAECH